MVAGLRLSTAPGSPSASLDMEPLAFVFKGNCRGNPAPAAWVALGVAA